MKNPVHTGRIKYERHHLLQKLNLRDPAAPIRLMSEKELAVHPIFEPAPGCIEEWKITKP
jgi:hypothetical protein